jgi:hypothetical protein
MVNKVIVDNHIVRAWRYFYLGVFPWFWQGERRNGT